MDLATYYVVFNEIPVKLVRTPDGGLDILAFDTASKRFVREMRFGFVLYSQSGDFRQVSEDEFHRFITRINRESRIWWRAGRGLRRALGFVWQHARVRRQRHANGIRPPPIVLPGENPQDLGVHNDAMPCPTDALTRAARRHVEAAAEAGDIDAMLRLAEGLRGEDNSAAWQWMHQAAVAGSTNAMLEMAKRAATHEEARGWYERAAKAGDGFAMQWLAGGEGELAERWYKPACHYLEERAASGDEYSMRSLAVLLQRTDQSAARRWYEAAAQSQDRELASQAMWLLGNMLLPDNVDEARSWYERSAALGSSAAMMDLGKLLEHIETDSAIGWYERASEAGVAVAAYHIGRVIEEQDPGAGRRRWEEQADAGDSDAMFWLGRLYELQMRDLEGAERWYERAANAGNVRAMLLLGDRFETGSPDQARDWYRLAAGAQNGWHWMRSLSDILQEDDPERAFRWYNRSLSPDSLQQLAGLNDREPDGMDSGD